MANVTVRSIIDIIRTLIDDETRPYRFTDKFLLTMLSDEYKLESGIGKFLHFKNSITGDGTSRYGFENILTYTPTEIKRVFIGTEEIPRVRRLEADVLVGTPETGGDSLSNSDYVWKKVAFSDILTEQILTTGSGVLTFSALSSQQTALPAFENPVEVQLSTPYQDRYAYISTDPVIVSGNVVVGITLNKGGDAGVAYFDIIVRQL